MKQINGYIIEKLHLSKDTKYKKNSQIIVDMIKKITYDYLKDEFLWFKEYENELKFESECFGKSLEINLNFPGKSNFNIYRERIRIDLFNLFKKDNSNFEIKSSFEKSSNIKFTFEL
jgi:hypothetical protein